MENKPQGGQKNYEKNFPLIYTGPGYKILLLWEGMSKALPDREYTAPRPEKQAGFRAAPEENDR